MIVRLLFLLSVTICIGAAWKPLFHLGRRIHGNKHLADGVTITKPKKLIGSSVTEGWFTQQLDHFDTSNNATWSQKYYSNMKWFQSGKSHVIFLMIGGEGPESGSWVSRENLPYLQWAEKVNAAVFDMEHRFYGESHPTPDQSVANLKYLTSRQAIEDIAAFIKSKNAEMKFNDPHWITFGGSYSGALSLWARAKHPELIAGAVGSSGPVQATLDFYKYLEVVQNSISRYSQTCAANIKDGFCTIIKLMNTISGRQTLSTTFQLTPPFSDDKLDYNTIQNFYSNIYGNFQGAVQYSGDNTGPYRTAYNIPSVCDIMTNTINFADNLSRIAAVNRYMSTMGNAQFAGTDNNYQGMIDYLKVTGFQSNQIDNFDSGARSWTWQTCSEFGYFQSTDSTDNEMFGPVTPNNLFINMCSDIFGTNTTRVDALSIQAAVDSTNKYYGGAAGYPGTNVVIPNGNVDPWHALGTYTSRDISVVPYLIDGTAHCADMYPVPTNGTYPPGIDTVHALILQNIRKWIAAPIDNRVLPPTQSNWYNSDVKNTRIVRQKRSALQADVDDVRKRMLTEVHTSSPHPGYKPTLMNQLDQYPSGFLKGGFEQLIDHFDNTNPNTFSQKYCKNTQFAKPGGPNFLMIGGEGPESESWVLNTNLTWMQYAQTYGATVWILEHRYYGESVLPGQTSMSNNLPNTLQYLTSMQMLQDVAAFIQAKNNEMTTNATWVTFGGGYSGTLALNMRQMFPSLVSGAVASSAPVVAKMDFFEHLQIVESSIRSYSSKCADNIGAAFDSMHKLMMNAQGRNTLSDTFALVPRFAANLTEVEKQFFFYNIYGQFQAATQFSGDNAALWANGYGIPAICDQFMLREQDPIQNVADFNKYMIVGFTGKNFTNTPNSYADNINYLKKANTMSAGDGAIQYWAWQTCNEFGYMTSTDLGYGIFGSPVPVNYFTQMCIDVFGSQFSSAQVEANVQTTNLRYGGKDNYKGTNVILPNGSLDPWKALGLLSSNDSTVVTYLINGAAHCADMYPSRDSDVPDLKTARQIISTTIGEWLGTAAPTTTTTAQSTPTTSTATNTTTTLKPTPAPKQENKLGSALLTATTLFTVLISSIL